MSIYNYFDATKLSNINLWGNLKYVKFIPISAKHIYYDFMNLLIFLWRYNTLSRSDSDENWFTTFNKKWNERYYGRENVGIKIDLLGSKISARETNITVRNLQIKYTIR